MVRVFVDFPIQNALVFIAHIVPGADLITVVQVIWSQFTGDNWLLDQKAHNVKPEACRIDAKTDPSVSKQLEITKT